jgi:hypothetical protein
MEPKQQQMELCIIGRSPEFEQCKDEGDPIIDPPGLKHSKL